MRKTKILTIIFFIIFIFQLNVYAAEQVTYYDNGNPKQIVDGLNTISYYGSGKVSKIQTAEGTANYAEDGKIDSVVGTPSITYQQATDKFEEIKKQPTNIEQESTDNNVTEDMPVTGIDNSYLLIGAVILVSAILVAVRIKLLN